MPIHGSYGHYAIDKSLTTSNDSGTQVFVYDTTRDSDGGAWRHRTQHTSWYNEASSSIRSSRKEFPQVAVIYYDGNNLDIHDADDPNLPLWMRFTRNGGSMRDVLYGCGSGGGQGGGMSGLRIHMLNGILAICSTDTNFWPILIDFIKDDCVGIYQTSNPLIWWGGNLSERNTTSTDNNKYWSGDNAGMLINGWWIREGLHNNTACNDVDMRVLPGAPINPSTGIEIPSIMFAKGDNDIGASSTTIGSVDIVLHSGEVIVKETLQNWNRFARFIDDDQIVVARNAYAYIATASIDADTGESHPSGWVTSTSGSGTGYGYFRANTGQDWPAQRIDSIYDLSNDNTYTNTLTATKDAYAVSNNFRTLGGCGNGITIYAAGQNKSATYRRAAFIDRWGSSGWLYGKCRQAVLCDSCDTAPQTGAISSPDILTNGNFTSDISGWTDNSGSGSNIAYNSGDSGRLDLNGAAAYAHATQAVTVEIGKAYTVIATPSAGVFGSNQELQLYVGTSGGGTSQDIGRADWKKGTHDDAESPQVSFVAERTPVYVSLSSGWNVAVVAVEMRAASMDRSGYQAEGLSNRDEKARAIFWNGTLTLTPVATGCELGAWSGFNGSSYFYQYWNTAHNAIGTSSMYIMCWIKGNSGIVWHKAETGGLDCRAEFNGSNQIRFSMTNNGSISFYSNKVFEPDVWTHVVWVKSGARTGQLFIDGEFDNGGAATSDMNWNANNTSRFGIGQRPDNAGNEAFNGHITLFKLGEGAPSAHDIRQIYKDEKKLFVPGAKMSLGGDSGHVKAVDYDHSTDLLHVGTNYGTSAFEGIVRKSYDAGAVTKSISAAAGIVAKI